MHRLLTQSQEWQYRAVAATQGNQSMLGCFVLAVLGWQHGRKPPRFGSKAYIDANGQLFSNMQDASGHMFRNQHLGPVEDVINNFRGLADHLKLDDKERKEMFGELKKWIVHDARANQTNEERGLLH